jgi:hypothetical protein
MDSLQGNEGWRQIRVGTCHLFNELSRLSISGLGLVCLMQSSANLHILAR